jgi:hypothetical protein
VWDLAARGIRAKDFQALLGAAGETETARGNIQDWLQLREGDPQLELLVEEGVAVVMYSVFICTAYIIKFSIYLFSKLFRLSGLSFA